MPLSGVCVSTVGGRHKPWSSRTSSPAKDAQDFMTMNSSEEICNYRENSQNIYTALKKPAYFEYDISDDKPTKKEKKWSFGNLFRRKKKTNDSSSDEEGKDKSKKKSEKRKKPITFDHIVITPSQVKLTESRTFTAKEKTENKLVVSPQVVSNQNKSLPSDVITTHQPTVEYEEVHVTSLTSLDNLSRKSRKDLTKVRAEARRTSLNRNSSSDEDSQRSNSSQKFVSDESLGRIRDSSCNRRSRAARTERYLKRHSRDGENPNNYLRISKSDAESTFLRVSDESTRSPSASPQLFKSSFSSLSSQTPSVIGLSTIPPSHTNHGRFRVSNSTSNPSYKPPLSMNDYNNTAKTYTSQRGHKILPNQRSISFDADIHRPHDHPEVIYAKLELGKPRRNLTLVDNLHLRRYYNVYQPPAPPPRDPKRLHGSLILDTLNHNNFNDCVSVNARYNLTNDVSNPQVRRMNLVNRPAFKSSSENHIPRDSNVILSQRPSSTTPETTIRRNFSSDGKSRSENYQYLTDKQPRSRKPIFIQNELKKSVDSNGKVIETQCDLTPKDSGSFLEQLQAKKTNRYSRGGSPQMFNCETRIQTEIFLPSVLPNRTRQNKNIQQGLTDEDRNKTEKHLDVVNQNDTVNIEEEESTKKKSANLEEALNELEAIYNSLKLGDEDLLEMAEKREKEITAQKLLESSSQYPTYARGAFSDSSFSYEPFDSLDSRRRKKYSRKSLRSDDMAFRKLHKQERAATITDPQSVSSKVSYLLNSPIYSSNQRVDDCCDPNEPDATLDDVVYRNIKQSNKLKVPEHPPPFGIPLGPIALAANSDYLHAIPDAESVKPSKMPDLVKDDLAYRNLRKDSTKEPALPPVLSDDLKNNNMSSSLPSPSDTPRVDLAELKKKRAVRSKSANIGSLISKEVIERASRRNARDKTNEYKALTDIADAMQIAHQVLKEKEKKFNENKNASLSDSDSVYSKYSRFCSTNNKTQKTENGNDNHTNISFYSPKVEESLDSDANKVFDDLYRSLSKKEKPEQTRSQVKESTPDPISYFEDGKLVPLLRTNSFEDVLTALAIEAKEASDKFTEELKELDVKKMSNSDITIKSNSPSSCSKLLEAAADIDSPKKLEKKKDEEDIVMESVATIIFSKHPQDIESDHDYENLRSDIEMSGVIGAPDGISESLLDGKIKNETQRNIEANIPKYCDLNSDIQDKDTHDATGETCVDVVLSNAFKCISVNHVSHEQNSIGSCLSNSDSFGTHSHASSSECDGACSNEKSVSKIELSQSLKSPKLVLESSKFNDRRKRHSNVFPRLSCNSIQPSSSQNFLDLDHIPDNSFKSTCIFENNPASLAIACSYGVACLYQLAAFDLFTVLGIILAIFSFIASLLF